MAHTPDQPTERARADVRKREIAEPIPDSFENVVGAVLNTPAKKNWRYESKQ